MYTQLGLLDLIAAVQEKVEDKTGLKCYDAVPDNASSPFYFAEVVGKGQPTQKQCGGIYLQFGFMRLRNQQILLYLYIGTFKCLKKL